MGSSESRRILKKARFEAGLCVYCGVNPFAPDKKGCYDCLDEKYQTHKTDLSKHPDRQKSYRLKIRKQVLEKYGGKCVCCGESNWAFLVIDHINDDGYIERREKYGSQSGASFSFVLELNRNPIRTDLQILCWNCNATKSLYGSCPHSGSWIEPEIIDIDLRRGNKKNFTTIGKIKWPPINDLVKMVLETNCSDVARKLGVHDTAIRGRLKRRGLYIIVQQHVKQKRDQEKIQRSLS